MATDAQTYITLIEQNLNRKGDSARRKVKLYIDALDEMGYSDEANSYRRAAGMGNYRPSAVRARRQAYAGAVVDYAQSKAQPVVLDSFVSQGKTYEISEVRPVKPEESLDVLSKKPKSIDNPYSPDYIPPNERRSYNIPQPKTFLDPQGRIVGVEDPLARGIVDGQPQGQSYAAPPGRYFTQSSLDAAQMRRGQAIEASLLRPPITETRVVPYGLDADNSGFEGRIEKMLEREARVETLKESVYGFTGIGKNPMDPWVIGQAKGVARFPIEVGSFIPIAGGRAAFIGEALFNKAGRQELKDAFGRVPGAVIESYNWNNPDFTANVLGTAIMFKGAASRPPAALMKLSRNYVPYEKAGFKVTPDVTQPYSKAEILGTQGKTVTGIHASFQNLFEKSWVEKITQPGVAKTEVIIKPFPDMAKGFRKAIGQFSFYKSLPEKGSIRDISVNPYERIRIKDYSVNPPKNSIIYTESLTALPESVSGYSYTRSSPQLYGGYIGLGKGAFESSAKLKVTIGEPTRYAYVFKNEFIQPVSQAEMHAARIGGVEGGRAIMNIQRSQPGSAFIAAENLLGRSIEGQYVNPEGTIIKGTSFGKYTYYQEPPTSSNPFGRAWQKLTNPEYKINIIEAEAVRGERVASPNLETPKSITPESSYFSRSLSVKPLPGISLSTMSKSVSSKSMTGSVSSPSRSLKPSTISTSISLKSLSSALSGLSGGSRSGSSRSYSSPSRSTSPISTPIYSGPTSSMSKSIGSVSIPSISIPETSRPKFSLDISLGSMGKKRSGKPAKSKAKYKSNVRSRLFGIKTGRMPRLITPFTNRPIVRGSL